jgi:PhnB protein
MMTHEESPEETGPEWRNKILHAVLDLGDTKLLASDCPPGYFKQPQGFKVSLSVGDPEKADSIFHALADGGDVTMALGTTFFARRFGMLVDSFGIPWMIICE